MFFSLATIFTTWRLSSRYIFFEVTQRRCWTPLWWTVCSVIPLGYLCCAASQSSLSLGVNALQNIRKIRSLDHHCTQCFDMLRWLESMSLHNSERCSERRCRALEGPTFPERTSKIKKTFYLSSKVSIWKTRCLNISCSSLVFVTISLNPGGCFPVKTATSNQCFGKLRADAVFPNHCSLLDQSPLLFDVDFHHFKGAGYLGITIMLAT